MNSNEWFIDGSALPQPLTKEETKKLIELTSNGSLEARDELIKHNIRLVLYEVSNKFFNVEYDKKDLVSIGNIGLLKAIDTYNLSKGFEFTTYATRCIDNEILMFLRKLKKYQNIDSFESVVFQNKDGSEITLEDRLSDDIDLVEDYEKKETYIVIRKLISELPRRDKLIIMMHFGFYDDHVYTQKEISNKLNISQSYVSRLVTKIVKNLRNQLENNGMVSLYTRKKQEREKENKDMKRLQSIYEYFSNYSKQQINEMLLKLTDEERALITIRYGEDLANPVQSQLTKEQTNKFYGSLIPKMKKLLANPATYKIRKTKERKIEDTIKTSEVLSSENNMLSKSTLSTELVEDVNITKEDGTMMLELLKTPLFAQMLNMLTAKEAVIFLLKLGCINGKPFSTESIAAFLKIEKLEVINTTKKVLLFYKENIKNINKLLDSAFAIVTDESEQGISFSIK